MLVSLFERPKYLSGYFDSTLSKIQRHSQVFERLLSQKMPRLYRHLKENGIDPLLYITPWFMALYTSLPCWDSVLTIWDLLLLEGVSVIFQTSLGILHIISDELLSRTGIAQILPILLRLPAERLKRSYFVPVMWRWTIFSWEVNAVLAIITDTSNVQSNQGDVHQCF
ncbi:USP6 N-terminal [Paramuricea clavata]|uniref:USP6 N-terminal n=1 Tax=Paramuricea clavata TaxID=317549 RepID=A0A7D9J4F8_PARCT|nr:USP6 N-terminal [Paramuricea clavata]